MSLIKKISSATVFGTQQSIKETLENNDNNPVSLYKVYGIAHNFKTGTSLYGDYTALLGVFKAENLITGECFEANQLYLPPVGMEMIEPVIVQVRENKGNMELGIIVGVKPSDKAVGYEYEIHNLLPVKQLDAMSELEKKMKQLEAPKETPKEQPKETTKRKGK